MSYFKVEKAVTAFSHFDKHPMLMMNHPKSVSIPRVYIVEDHPLFSTVLSEILKESGEFDVVGCTTDGAVANEFIRDNTVELLLVDMMLPGVTGMEILANLRDLQKPTKAVVLSGLGSDESIAAAFTLGAADYIEKRSEPAEILSALRAVVRGEPRLSPRISQILRDLVRRNLRCKPLAAVDLRVLKGLARNESPKSIALEMGLSLSGVYKARARIVARTGADDWTGFAWVGASYGLVPEQDSGISSATRGRLFDRG